MKKLIHFGNTGGKRIQQTTDYYLSLNKDYKVKFYNIDYSNLSYTNSFTIAKPKFVQKNHALFFQQELLKLTVLRKYGGWMCNTINLLQEPFDNLIDRYKLHNSLGCFQHGCDSGYNLFIPKNWGGWQFVDNLINYECAKSIPPHPYLVLVIINTLAPLHKDLFKLIENNKIIQLEIPNTINITMDEQKNSPKAVSIIKRYMAAHNQWESAGRPIRSEAEKKRIFEICTNCKHVQKDLFGFKCGICKCRLHDSRNSINKIAMSTEFCADNPRRWDAEV